MKELDALLEKFDDLSDKIAYCKTDLERRKELLKQRRVVKEKINTLIDENFYSKL